MKTSYEKLGKNIRRCRLLGGHTQEDLSDTVGIHYTFLGHIERGNRLPSIPTLLRIAKALEVQPAKLLAGIEEEAS